MNKLLLSLAFIFWSVIALAQEEKDRTLNIASRIIILPDECVLIKPGVLQCGSERLAWSWNEKAALESPIQVMTYYFPISKYKKTIVKGTVFKKRATIYRVNYSDKDGKEKHQLDAWSMLNGKKLYVQLITEKPVLSNDDLKGMAKEVFNLR
jgi:hypothetical protein